MIKNKTVGGCVRNPRTPLHTGLGICVRMANTPSIAVCIAIFQLAQTAFYIYRATRTRMKSQPHYIKAVHMPENLHIHTCVHLLLYNTLVT